MGTDKLVDIDAKLVGESAMAYKINDGKREVWVPKSEAQDNEDGTFTMPEWIAKEKGLI
jgi:hypothetical protein